MATKTFEELKQMAIQIRDEKTNKQNTATRIGTQMVEHLNKLEQDFLDKETTEDKFSKLLPNTIFQIGVPFILDAYIPNVPKDSGKIGICTVVKDIEKNEFRINIYKVDDNGQYTDASGIDGVKISNIEDNLNGIIISTTTRGNILVIDLFNLNKSVKDGVNNFKSVFSDIVKVKHLGLINTQENTEEISKSNAKIAENAAGINEINSSIKIIEFNSVINDFGTNLIDPKRIETSKYIDPKSGKINTGGESFGVTSYIPVNKQNIIGNVLVADYAAAYAVFDENLSFLRTIVNSNKYTYQEGDFYVIMGLNGLPSDKMANYGDEIETYTPFTPLKDVEENRKAIEKNSKDIEETKQAIEGIEYENVFLNTGRTEESYTNKYNWSHYYNIFLSGTYNGVKVKFRDITEVVHIAKINVDSKELSDIKVLETSDYVKNDWNIISFDEPVTLESNEQICVYSTVACVYVSYGSGGIIEGETLVNCGYYKLDDSSWGATTGTQWNHAIIPFKIESKYASKDDVNALQKRIEAVENTDNSYSDTVIVPHSIYLTQDAFDIKDTRPHRLYIDHLVNMDKFVDICFDKTKTDIYHLSADINTALDADKKELPLSISLNNIKNKKSFTLNRRISKTSVGDDVFVRLMQLGDSVGGGFGGNSNTVDNNPGVSWAVTQKLFMLDRIKFGDYDNKYKMQTLGFRNSVAVKATYDTTTKTSVAYGEGRGGWRLTDYLYRKFQGETGVEQEPTESSVFNPFYDEDKVWVDSELNEKGVKFSLKKYLERFRNYTDDGVKIEQGGEGIGTNITFDGTSNTSQLIVRDNAAFVCTPTHFISQLGFNDVETPKDNDADYPDFVENTRLLIKAIKEEFPDMIIGISMIDSAGGYFPQYYREYSNEDFLNMLGNGLHSKIFNWIEKIYNICSEADNVYFIPNYFIQPTIKGCQWYDLIGTDGEVSKYVGTNGNYHPNNIAHSAWGQQIYNWIKWTLIE